jgi:hypothetical protein
MKKLVDTKMATIRPGQKFLAVVRAVRNEGVYVEMPDGRGSATITPRCWGDGEARMNALSSIRTGDEFEVVVRSIDIRTRTLSLVLVGCEDSIHQTKKANTMPNAAANVPHWTCKPHKPDFQPIPDGTVFLWDVANLFGKIGPGDAAWKLDSIARSLEAQGYRSLFFIERRSLTWAMHNQLSASDAAALDEHAHRDDFSIVADGGMGRKDEADCAILQVAEAIPNAVCVSHDHYGDYAKAHSGIVGTDRVRSFTVTRLDDTLFISINGLKCAIVVETKREETVCDSEMASVREAISASVADVGVEGCHRGLLAVADEYMRRGDAKNAERVYAKVAKKNPAAYLAMADMYREGVGVRPDVKKASVKRVKEREVRDRRRRVQSIRCGRTEPHFAEKRMHDLNMVAFYEKSERFTGTRGRIFTFGRAA